MALKWIPNELVLKHKGVFIYHIYRHDDHEGGVREYCFGLDEFGSDDGTDEDSGTLCSMCGICRPMIPIWMSKIICARPLITAKSRRIM